MRKNSKRKKKLKLPSKLWFIQDEINGHLWGPVGWFSGEGDMFLFETFTEADEMFNKIPGRLFGACIMEMLTDDI